MKVGGVLIEFDVEAYLEQKGLSKVRPVGDNIMGCCPFHHERQPSFGVNTETGAFNCFGCGEKGSIGQLVKLLDKFDTVYDAEEYLINLYGRYAANADEAFELEFDDTERVDYWIDDSLLTKYRFRHPYLTNRGISEKWQRGFEIGYDQQKKAITIPWRDEKGRLLSVKCRKVTDKQFWYEPSMPSRIKAATLWGFDKVLRSGFQQVALTEGEIDSLSVWQSGLVASVAVGGNQLTDAQAAKLIKWLPHDAELIWFGDNDAGGDLLKQKIIEKLSGRFKVSAVDWSLINGKPKDANDLCTDDISRLIESRSSVGIELTFGT